MGRMWRKQCDGTKCRDPAFFKPQRAPAGDDQFFPEVQRQEAPKVEEEKKDPITEGLKTTGGKLLENEALKKWAEPQLGSFKYTLWEKRSKAEKIALASFLGTNLAMGGAMFALNPQLRLALSDVNLGKALGLIPWSPIDGFKYKLPEPGKTGMEFSADFTLNPYLGALQKRRPGFFLSGANFGLESSYDPAGKGFGITGGKFGLDLFGGALKAEGKTFKELSPYPQMIPGREPGGSPSWLMQENPGMPMLKQPGYQFMLNADMLKLFPWLRKNF